MPDKKRRPSIPESIKAQILFQNDHSCCMCHKSPKQGIRIQIHHINDNPSDNSLGNLAVLCRDCHDRLRDKVWMGQGYYQDEVKKYKVLWENIVSHNRDRLSAQQLSRAELLKYAESAYTRYIEFMRDLTNSTQQIPKFEVNETKSASVDRDEYIKYSRKINSILTEAGKAYAAYSKAQIELEKYYKGHQDQTNYTYKEAEREADNIFNQSTAKALKVLKQTLEKSPELYQQSVAAYEEVINKSLATRKKNIAKAWKVHGETVEEAWRIFSSTN